MVKKTMYSVAFAFYKRHVSCVFACIMFIGPWRALNLFSGFSTVLAENDHCSKKLCILLCLHFTNVTFYAFLRVQSTLVLGGR